MTNSEFAFDIYRLNVIDDSSVLKFDTSISCDRDIISILAHVATAQFDKKEETSKSQFVWHCREYEKLRATPEVIKIILARSTVQQHGQTVTTQGLVDVNILNDPPPATAIVLIFHFRRHLVAVEHNAALMKSHRWQSQFHEMLDHAGSDLGFQSSIRLEPVPRDEEIIRAFLSFSRVTRLRLRLRIANPELSRYAKFIQDTMKECGIRDYLQDMRSASGLSQGKDKVPYASVELAQSGYKEGEVVIEGIQDGNQRIVRTGNTAAQGRITIPNLREIRQFVKGAGTLAKTKEGRMITESILVEIDRIAPPPMDDVR